MFFGIRPKILSTIVHHNFASVDIQRKTFGEMWFVGKVINLSSDIIKK